MSPAFAFDFYGAVEADSLYFSKDIEGRDRSRPTIDLSLTVKGSLSEKFHYKINPIGSFDPISEVQEQKNFFDVNEAYIEFLKNIFSLKAGWLQMNWGVTEGYDPAAVIQSYRIWNLLDLKPLASPSILTQWGWSDSQFEFVVIPRRRKSMLPGGGSRWLPDQSLQGDFVVDDQIIVLPNQLQYSYQGSQELNKAMDWNYGLRYYAQWGALEWSIFFFEGAAAVPYTQLNLTVDRIELVGDKTTLFLNSNIGLTPLEYRLQTTGGTLVYSFGNAIFRYAMNYQHHMGVNNLISRWQTGNVFGLEMSWFDSGDLVSIFEYSKVKRAGELNSTASSMGRIFDNSYLVALRYSISENWSVLATLLYEVEFKDKIYQVSMQGKVFDELAMKVAWVNLEEGGAETALAGYTKNDHVSLGFEYFF